MPLRTVILPSLLLVLFLTACGKPGPSPSGEPTPLKPNGGDTPATVPPVVQPQGTTSSGGGDGVAAEFMDLARALAREIVSRPYINPFPPDRLNSLLERLRIESTEAVLRLDGILKDVLSYPTEARTVVQRQRWQQMTKIQKERLVLHELFVLLEVEDSSYEESEEILRLLGRTGLGPSTASRPSENPPLVRPPFGTFEAGWWEYPDQTRLVPIPARASQTTEIKIDRIRRAVNSTQRVSFALFEYVNQLFFQRVSENIRERLRAQMAHGTNELYRTTENRMRTSARGFLLRQGVDLDLDAYENSITSSAFFRNQFTQELRWVRYIRLVGREYVLNENVPSRAISLEVLEEIKYFLGILGNRTNRQSLERACFENPNEPRLVMRNAISWLWGDGAYSQLNGHHLTEAEFIYMYNKILTPEQIEIEFPSQFYQTCLKQ